LGRVSNRDWRRAPDVFWYSDSEPLIEIPGVLAKFIEWFRASQHSGSAQSLISAYIQAFDGSSRTIETIGSELRRFLTATQSVRFIKWRERQQEYHLFEPALAPGAIAKRVLGSDNPIGAIYHEIGIDGENTWSNIGRRSLAAAFQAVEIAFRNNDVNAIGFLQRLRAWLELKGPLKSLALETKYYLARTLVTPWENGNPPPALLDPLKEFIHDLLGDPRSSDFAWREGRLDAVRWKRFSGLSINRRIHGIGQTERPFGAPTIARGTFLTPGLHSGRKSCQRLDDFEMRTLHRALDLPNCETRPTASIQSSSCEFGD
jgi:hypothetical protein